MSWRAVAGKYPNGFTLIEILVAITIIGIIFGIIISSATAIQKSGRNAQRRTDLRTIQTALQQYYADQQKFPYQALGSSIKSPDNTKIYLKIVPTDPQNAVYSYTPLTKHTGGAACTATSECNYYTLCIQAELPASELNTTDCPAGGSYFGVTPL